MGKAGQSEDLDQIGCQCLSLWHGESPSLIPNLGHPRLLFYFVHY